MIIGAPLYGELLYHKGEIGFLSQHSDSPITANTVEHRSIHLQHYILLKSFVNNI